MTNKLTDDLKLTIKREFIEGFIDANNVRQYPTLDALAKRHKVARATLFRRAKDEDWQSAKNSFQTKLESQIELERMKSMVDESKRLDRNALQIAQALLNRVGRRLQKGMELEQANPTITGIEAGELRELSQVAANAQKIGKLALGEAQEIAKVSADVSTPESFQRVMEALDELAEVRSRRHNHTLQ